MRLSEMARLQKRGYNRRSRFAEVIGLAVVFIGFSIWIYSESWKGPVAFAICSVVGLITPRVISSLAKGNENIERSARADE